MTRHRKLDEEIEAHRAEVAAERERRNATIATKLREATDSRNLTRLLIAIAEGKVPTSQYEALFWPPVKQRKRKGPGS